MKRFFAYLLIFMALACVALPGLMVFSALSGHPAVQKGPELTFDRVKRVKVLVKRHRPRFLGFRQVRHVRINEDDLDLLLDYGISQILNTDRIRADVRLADGMMILDTSTRIVPTPLGRYVNLSLGIHGHEKHLELGFIQAGSFRIPGWLIQPVVCFMLQHLLPEQILQPVNEGLSGIRSISFGAPGTSAPKTLSLVYDWNPQVLTKVHEQGKAILFPRLHQEKLVDYTNRITQSLTILNQHLPSKKPRPLSLARILPPLFKYAGQKAQTSNDPVLENTALIQSLALYAIGRDLSSLVNKELLNQVTARQHASFTLAGRDDLAKHFLISAGIAVSAGSGLSRFAGLAKEVGDADKGSGFSFADLAADSAGVRFGELAGSTRNRAQQILDRMAGATREQDFMPAITRLPEGIMELEFKRRYKDLDSQAYEMIDNEIQRRLDQCGVYR